MMYLIKNKFLITLVLIGLTLLYVRARFLVVELSFDAQKMRNLKLELEDVKKKYLLEKSTLQNPQNIQNQAFEKYGLGFENENAITIYVQE